MKNQRIYKSLTKFLLSLTAKQPLAFIVFVISPITIILKTNVIPYALKLIIDIISNYNINKDLIFTDLSTAIWIGSISWLGLICIERFHCWVQSIAVPRFESNMRIEAVHYTLNHSHEFFNDQFAGDIANKVTSLIKALDNIRKIISANIITAISVILAALILMYFINPIFSLIVFLWVVLQMTTTFYFAKRINITAGLNAMHKGIISGMMVDILTNIAAVKLFAKEKYELYNIKTFQTIEEESNTRLLSTINKLYLLTDSFVTIVLGSIFYILIKGWQQNYITAGDFVFVVYMIFAIMNQMSQLSHALADFFREIGIAQDALNVITQTPKILDKNGAKPLIITSGKIEFKHVYFDYPNGNRIFQNLNVVIKPKEKIGIVGYSGSGKSTFINLLLRFYDLDSGLINVDGQNIAEVQQVTLRDSISVILQDTNLFHRSLLENIRYGKMDATQQEVIAASEKAHCNSFIQKCPMGYDTLVGERGGNLSGGQKQRIAIARALLKKSPIVILDEATSALDSETEELIVKNLDELFFDKTVIVIAHRLSTLLKMDRILVFSEGEIVEDGTHEELLKAKKHYRKMWDQQLKGFISI